MSDLISREALKKEIFDVYEYEYPTASGEFDKFVTQVIPNIINNILTVDAVEVVHGHWIKPTVIDGRAFNIPHCSICNEVPCGVDENTNYCPNCGAKMDEVNE